MPAFTNVSAAQEPAGPDPTTATRSVKAFLPIFSISLYPVRCDGITEFLGCGVRMGDLNEMKQSLTIGYKNRVLGADFYRKS